MNKKVKVVLITLLAFFVIGFSITVNAAKPTPVEVINTPYVNVVNLPAVQEVSGAVEVVGTPDVNVANTTPISVTVTNGALLREPYSDVAYDDGMPWADFHTVPTGKRLHVEHVSAWLLIDPGEYMYCSIRVLQEVGQQSFQYASHDLLMSASGVPSPGGQLYITSTPITFTADEDQFPQLDCSTGDSDPNMRGSITGYLVDLPPQ